jgi:hypothetical protein
VPKPPGGECNLGRPTGHLGAYNKAGSNTVGGISVDIPLPGWLVTTLGVLLAIFILAAPLLAAFLPDPPEEKPARPPAGGAQPPK